jgi:hypothetical protein
MAEGLNCDLFAFVRGTLKARSGLDAFFLLSTPKYAKKIYENQASHAYAEKKMWSIPKPFRFLLSRLEKAIESLSCKNMNVFA